MLIISKIKSDSSLRLTGILIFVNTVSHNLLLG